MPLKKSKCEGWHSLKSEIEEAKNPKDLAKRIADWPSGVFIGRSEKQNEEKALEDARQKADDKAREAAKAWCKARPPCDEGKSCRVGEIKGTAPIVYSEAMEEYVAYLTITRIECKCVEDE